LTFSGHGQSSKIDSLKVLFGQSQIAKDSFEIYLQLADEAMSGNPLEALKYIEPANKIASQSGDQDLIHDVLYKEALVIRNMRKHQEALEKFETYIEYQKAKKNQSKLAKGLSSAGSLYVREAQFEKGEKYIQEALAYYQEKQIKKEIGFCFRNLGSLHRRQGNYSQALEYCHQAMDLFKEVDDGRSVANMHNSLGILYRMMKNDVKSKEHFNLTYDLALKYGDQMKAANALMNIGSISEPEEGTALFEEATNIYKQLGVTPNVVKGQLNLGINYKNIGEHQKAITTLKAAEKSILDKKARPFPILNQILGELYAQVNDRPKANSYLEKAADQLKDITDIHDLANGYNTLARSYSKIGNYKAAYLNGVNYNDINDSIYKVDLANKIAEIETERKVSEKDSQISDLQIKDELTQLKLSRKNMFLGSSIAAIVLLSFFLRQRSIQNKKIELQNKKIKQTLEEKDTLIREIHHRVKNNLQVISSLLNIQSRSIDDEKAKEAILVGRTRVRSMSLIHQNLYNKDNLSAIDMTSYLPTLAEDIFQTYKTSEGNITIETDIDQLLLDVDTVVPIGLIVNELITNALKYAFPNNSNGKIKLTLKEIEKQLHLSISDNGIGMSDSEVVDKTDSFGHKLIRAFKHKLNADINISVSDGTEIELIIKNYKKAV